MRDHIPSLDGLRGLAVVIVLLAHGTPLYVSGAFGVDVFFVLSGFLITGILSSELTRLGEIKLGNFYARRFLRLLPALWITVAAVTANKARNGAVDYEFSKELIASLSYTMNWLVGLGLGKSQYLEHTWSLAVEEQYYIVWPFVLIALRSLRLTLRQQASILVASAIAIMAYRHLSGFSPGRIYRGIDTHCDGLLLGSATALWIQGGGKPSAIASKVLQLSAPIAVIGLLVLPAYCSWRMPFTVSYGYALVGILTTIVIIDLVTSRNSLLSGAMSIAPLRYVGRISYGLYLYHWPVLLWLRWKPWPIGEWGKFAMCMAMTFAIADLSFRLIERPILRLKDKYFASGGSVVRIGKE